MPNGSIRVTLTWEALEATKSRLNKAGRGGTIRFFTG